MNAERTTINGRIYQINSYTVAGGRLVKVRLESGAWSYRVPYTWGAGNHGPAVIFATDIAERHAAGEQIA